jgi:hypothetical protein
MADVLPFNPSRSVASSDDHVALRSLLKAMSALLGIPYKLVADRAGLKEQQIKSYANEKAMRGEKQQQVFEAVTKSVSELLPSHVEQIKEKTYILHILLQLLGSAWLKQNGLELATLETDAPPDRGLVKWLNVLDQETAEVERSFSGLWRIIRSATPSSRDEIGAVFKLTSVNYSLLNIRPRHIGGNSLCDFRWYYRGRGGEAGDVRVSEGFVVPTTDRVDFLAKPSGPHSNMLSLMSWSYTMNTERPEHIDAANGIALTINSSNNPLGAHLRAFFISGSDSIEEQNFVTLRDVERATIGVKTTEELRALVPVDQYDRTIAYLQHFKPIVGFVPGTGDNYDV